MEELAQSSEPEQLEQLLSKVQSYNPQADEALIRRAYDYSARKHAEQKRMSGEPYVTHPLSVAQIIAELKLDVPSIVTGLLHDVVEDTATTPAEIESRFGAVSPSSWMESLRSRKSLSRAARKSRPKISAR